MARCIQCGTAIITTFSWEQQLCEACQRRNELQTEAAQAQISAAQAQLEDRYRDEDRYSDEDDPALDSDWEYDRFSISGVFPDGEAARAMEFGEWEVRNRGLLRTVVRFRDGSRLADFLLGKLDSGAVNWSAYDAEGVKLTGPMAVEMPTLALGERGTLAIDVANGLWYEEDQLDRVATIRIVIESAYLRPPLPPEPPLPSSAVQPAVELDPLVARTLIFGTWMWDGQSRLETTARYQDPSGIVARKRNPLECDAVKWSAFDGSGTKLDGPWSVEMPALAPGESGTVRVGQVAKGTTRIRLEINPKHHAAAQPEVELDSPITRALAFGPWKWDGEDKLETTIRYQDSSGIVVHCRNPLHAQSVVWSAFDTSGTKVEGPISVRMSSLAPSDSGALQIDDIPKGTIRIRLEIEPTRLVVGPADRAAEVMAFRQHMARCLEECASGARTDRERAGWVVFAKQLDAILTRLDGLLTGVVEIAPKGECSPVEHPDEESTVSCDAGGDHGSSVRLWLRDEFKNAIMGKTREQVLATVGTPDSTQDWSDNLQWYYKGRTKDPVTGKLDYAAQVVLEGGVVVRINF